MSLYTKCSHTLIHVHCDLCIVHTTVYFLVDEDFDVLLEALEGIYIHSCIYIVINFFHRAYYMIS